MLFKLNRSCTAFEHTNCEANGECIMMSAPLNLDAGKLVVESQHIVMENTTPFRAPPSSEVGIMSLGIGETIL